jgi:hypothetical protein
MLTPEQEKGTKFEVWLELLLTAMGHQQVFRNVEFRKRDHFKAQDHPRRQVDLSYEVVDNGKIYLAIVEAKYSSNGEVAYGHRKGEVQKGDQQIPKIDNIVDELVERQQFVRARGAFLVTNHTFDDQVKVEAGKHGIKVLEGDVLAKIHRELGREGDIDTAINAIYLEGHNLHKNILYVP